MAQNPIIQTKYTAYHAPMVYKDTGFLYTRHDEEDATNFKMFDRLRCGSTDFVSNLPINLFICNKLTANIAP